jgi:hypothetical protein
MTGAEMKLKQLAAVCALALAGPAMATMCSSSDNWGNLAVPGSHGFSNWFTETGSFNDCHSFTLGTAASADGWFLEWDVSNKLDIDVSSVSLFMGSTLIGSESGVDADAFNFGNLSTGNYRLEFAGNVGTDTGRLLGLGVGYFGSVSTVRAVAAPVPEPESYAMMLAGFFGVGFAALRRKKQA